VLEATAWATVAIGTTAWLASTRLRRGHLLSPFSIAVLLLVAIFGVRPLILAAEQDWWFNGVNVVGGSSLAATVGLCAVIALCFGYGLGRLILLQGLSQPARVGMVEVASTVRRDVSIEVAALVAAACTALWFVAMIAIGGGTAFLAQLAAGRSADVNRVLDGVPVLVSAIPVAGVVVLAACRLRISAARPISRRESLWYWGAIALALVPPLTLGNRRLLLPVAIVALLAVVRPTWNRRVPALGVAAAAASGLVVAAIPFVRSAGSRSTSPDLVGALGAYFEDNGVIETVRSFFVSYDTEMFSYIAMVGPHLGQSVEFGLGRATLGEALLQPLPAAIAPWPTWSNHLLTVMFGGGCGTVACPVPSVAGILFFDTGFIGVVAGMTLLGLAMSRFEAAFITADGLKLLLLLSLAGFMPGIIRGNSISQLWITANVLILAALLVLIMERFPGPSVRNHRPTRAT
jgi:hypothetical protein